MPGRDARHKPLPDRDITRLPCVRKRQELSPHVAKTGRKSHKIKKNPQLLAALSELSGTGSREKPQLRYLLSPRSHQTVAGDFFYSGSVKFTHVKGTKAKSGATYSAVRGCHSMGKRSRFCRRLPCKEPSSELRGEN